MADFVVTGGGGFIGSHLVDGLLAAGHRVTVLDDFSTGHRANVPRGVEIVVGDVADPELVSRLLATAAGCFHLAAIASVARANEDWPGTHRTNLGGTVAVLNAARARPGGRGPIPVVYASSAAVYGDNDALPLRESTELRPLSAYGADKLGSELHARAGWIVHRVPSVGLRLFNVYGPRQDPSSPYSGVISIFADRLKRGLPITIHGDGHQVRDFVHVADVRQAFIAAMDACRDGASVFNVSTGQATSIAEVATIIATALDAPAAFEVGPARPGDIRRSIGDPEAGRRALGLAPTAVPVEIGLADLVRRAQPRDRR